VATEEGSQAKSRRTEISQAGLHAGGRTINNSAAMTAAAKIQAIYRYPVKGLSPEPMARVWLAAGETLPGDRLYAIENGPSRFDPAQPRHQPKTHYLMLMRNERLATLQTRFDAQSRTLSISFEGREAVRGDLGSPHGRAAIERFFADFCRDELRGPPRLLHAGGFSFSDVARKVVSIINLASVAALEDVIGAAIDPLRFRGNVHVSGWPAWRELDLVGQEIAIGSNVRLRVVKRIVRCAATNVDPATGMRDLAIPDALRRAYGHADCGIYAEVVMPGEIAAEDGILVRSE
jgi:uncharacterized protein YcbX